MEVNNDISVSIACIVYNHERYLRKCLDGFVNQKTNFKFEIVIHDDSSTDFSKRIIEEYIEKYPNLIVPIFQDTNKYSLGVKPFIEYVIPRCKGKYIAFCEGDDFWTDDLKLQKQFDFLQENLDFSFCGHYVSRIVENKEELIIDEVLKSNEMSYKELSQIEVFSAHIPTLSLFFRNIDLNFRKDLYQAKNGDAVLIGLLALHGKGALLPFIGATYRVHNNGVFSSESYINNLVKTMETRIIMKNSLSFPSEYKVVIDNEIRKRFKKGIKYSVKRLDFLTLFRFIKKYVWH